MFSEHQCEENMSTTMMISLENAFYRYWHTFWDTLSIWLQEKVYEYEQCMFNYIRLLSVWIISVHTLVQNYTLTLIWKGTGDGGNVNGIKKGYWGEYVGEMIDYWLLTWCDYCFCYPTWRQIICLRHNNASAIPAPLINKYPLACIHKMVWVF